MDEREIKYANNATLADVVNDGFGSIDPGEGFEYTVGRIRGGKLKVIFEPDTSCFETVEIDGVEGFGYALVYEEAP